MLWYATGIYMMNDDQIDWNEVSFIKQLNELKTSWKCSLFIFVLLFGWLWWKMSKTRNCSSTESNEQNPMENICNIYIHHIGVLYVVYICVCVSSFTMLIRTTNFQLKDVSSTNFGIFAFYSILDIILSDSNLRYWDLLTEQIDLIRTIAVD